jgi:PadR family transcriptional regulator, regulatory protein AphA
MSLKYTLLGFLSYGPKTGYDLLKMFFEPLRPSQSQIYRKLNILNEEGLIECERVNQEKLPYKNVFSITDNGIAELKNWLKAPPEFIVPRETLLDKLWFGSLVTKKDMVNDVKKYANSVRREVESFKSTAGPSIESGYEGLAGPLDKLYWTLVVDRTIAQYDALLEWTETAIKLISSFDDSNDIKKKK